jgi:ATP-dependent exoDNAse (exonuclease V) alpha subunit
LFGEHRDLSIEQKAAVEMALSSPVSVLTGGPGTGKTTCIQASVVGG